MTTAYHVFGIIVVGFSTYASRCALRHGLPNRRENNDGPHSSPTASNNSLKAPEKTSKGLLQLNPLHAKVERDGNPEARQSHKTLLPRTRKISQGQNMVPVLQQTSGDPGRKINPTEVGTVSRCISSALSIKDTNVSTNSTSAVDVPHTRRGQREKPAQQLSLFSSLTCSGSSSHLVDMQ